MSAPMVLPPADEHGEVRADWLDERIPREVHMPGDPFGEHPVHPVGHYLASVECPDGRHLFDVLESLAETYREDPETGVELVEHVFHARLTCVRCGLIRTWEGTRRGDAVDPRALDPVPITAGDLTAQQTRGADWYGVGGGWTIYRAGVAVGTLERRRTQRGRVLYDARLREWPRQGAGAHVEGSSPAAALRRAAARVSTGPVLEVASTRS